MYKFNYCLKRATLRKSTVFGIGKLFEMLSQKHLTVV